MDGEDLRKLARLLVYGSPHTRRLAVERLLEGGDASRWSLLASTVRSQEPWLLRARCLEALGLAAGSGDRQTVETILGLLLNGAEPESRC